MNNAPFRLTQLTLITSETCNLNCSYCEIAKQAKHYAGEAEKLKASFLDGSYLNTIKNALSRFQCENEMESMEFWGQEPTLTLNEVATIVPDLFQLFPKWKKLFFSSNFAQYPERIINFIRVLEENAVDTFELTVQMSCDGRFATKNYRGIDCEKLLENAKIFLNMLNEIRLNKVQVTFQVHPVVSAALLYDLDTDDKILAYWLDLEDIALSLDEMNSNPKVTTFDSCFPGVQCPVKASSGYGKKVVQFFKDSKRICDSNAKRFRSKESNLIYNTLLLQVANRFQNIFACDYKGQRITPEFILQEMQKPFRDELLVKFLSDQLFCHPNVDFQIKVCHDGTLIYCQNAIYACRDIHKIDTSTSAGAARAAYRDAGGFLNINTCSDEELEKYRQTQAVLNNTAFPYLFNEVVQLMILLYRAGQIDESYGDINKLYRHAVYFAFLGSCLDDNLATTGTMVGRHAYLIREYGNGCMDLIDNYIEEHFIKGPAINEIR